MPKLVIGWTAHRFRLPSVLIAVLFALTVATPALARQPASADGNSPKPPSQQAAVHAPAPWYGSFWYTYDWSAYCSLNGCTSPSIVGKTDFGLGFHGVEAPITVSGATSEVETISSIVPGCDETITYSMRNAHVAGDFHVGKTTSWPDELTASGGSYQGWFDEPTEMTFRIYYTWFAHDFVTGNPPFCDHRDTTTSTATSWDLVPPCGHANPDFTFLKYDNPTPEQCSAATSHASGYETIGWAISSVPRCPNSISPDDDGDGLPDSVEASGPNKTDPCNPDSDHDGLLDGIEDSNHNGSRQSGETDPNKRDTDGDGLADGSEDKNHNGVVNASETDPRVADTDGDGLSDGAEVWGVGLVGDTSNPLKKDTDGDLFSDSQEVAAHSDPNKPKSKPSDCSKRVVVLFAHYGSMDVASATSSAAANCWRFVQAAGNRNVHLCSFKHSSTWSAAANESPHRVWTFDDTRNDHPHDVAGVSICFAAANRLPSIPKPSQANIEHMASIPASPYWLRYVPDGRANGGGTYYLAELYDDYGCGQWAGTAQACWTRWKSNPIGKPEIDARNPVSDSQLHSHVLLACQYEVAHDGAPVVAIYSDNNPELMGARLTAVLTALHSCAP